MLTAFFNPGPVSTWAGVAQSDTQAYASFFHRMMDRGVYLPPSQFEAVFVSLAHTPQQIAQATDLASAALASS